jgi:hypothetical protein
MNAGVMGHTWLPYGGVAEWTKATVLKTVEGVTALREFESLPLRKPMIVCVIGAW